MKTTPRFENAVTKLYNAFHSGKLNAMDCKACAVGNMCNNTVDWASIVSGYPDDYYNECVELEESPKWESYCEQYGLLKLKDVKIDSNGYSYFELSRVEFEFMMCTGPKKGTKETQFKGLCAVVKYLCKLDGIPNVMDYTSLFDTEENKPVNQLNF